MPGTERAETSGRSTEAILQPFATEMRHLTSALNMIASDMIRDRGLARKLDNDPDYFRRNYTVTDEELTAMREHNLIGLYQLGLHPFLLVRFAGMMGILEYWQALGAPGRGGGWPRNL
jgi:Aromatic-ring-opening dioxygenase LigAB, LigA subunit